MGLVAISSRTGLVSGMPYVAAVDEKIICLMPDEMVVSIKLRLFAVLLL